MRNWRAIMEQWQRRWASYLVLLVAAPIGVEFLISYIKNEDYSVLRAGVVLAGWTVALLFVITTWTTHRLQFMLRSLLAFLGIATAAIPWLAARSGRAFDGFDAAVICSGVTVVVLTACMTYLDRSGSEIFLAVGSAVESRILQEFDGAAYKVLLTKFSSFENGDEEVMALCRQEMDPKDVHFIGYYVHGKCRFHLDVLDSAELNRFFRVKDRAARRIAYERTGRQLNWLVDRLNAYIRRLSGGILIRTVLDVEDGAVYYYYVTKDVYLIALTMDQNMVLMVDHKLRYLANRIGVLPRGGVLGAPEDRVRQIVETSGG